MNQKSIPTRALTENEELLREKFYLSICTQSDLMDKLSERLLTLELSIPSLYAVVLKLAAGNDAMLTVNIAFYASFACWLFALVVTLAALMPKKWKVNTTILRQVPERMRQDGLGIEDFFERSAQYKRKLVIIASIVFFAGIVSATFTI